jgi:hypothetical protein
LAGLGVLAFHLSPANSTAVTDGVRRPGSLKSHTTVAALRRHAEFNVDLSRTPANSDRYISQ